MNGEGFAFFWWARPGGRARYMVGNYRGVGPVVNRDLLALWEREKSARRLADEFRRLVYG